MIRKERTVNSRIASSGGDVLRFKKFCNFTRGFQLKSVGILPPTESKSQT